MITKELTYSLNTIISNADISVDQANLLRKAVGNMDAAQQLSTVTLLQNNPKLTAPAAELLGKIDLASEDFETVISESLENLASQ